MPTITILGGGVAGLTLEATLDPTSYDVTIVERRPGWSPVPTAFGIWPFNRYRRLELFGGVVNYREQFEDVGLQQYSQQYQEQQFGRRFYDQPAIGKNAFPARKQQQTTTDTAEV